MCVLVHFIFLYAQFLHTPFYCYAYGFGNLLACSVFAQYKKQGHKIAEKFIALLSAGGSASPQDIVKLIGFDIASEGFWQQGFDVLKELLKGVKKNTLSKQLCWKGENYEMPPVRTRNIRKKESALYVKWHPDRIV